jgi:hypothetical protein
MQVVDNPLEAAHGRDTGQRFAGGETFDVESAPGRQRSKKGAVRASAQSQHAKKQDDDDIGGVEREAHAPRIMHTTSVLHGQFRLGETMDTEDVNSYRAHDRLRKQQRHRQILVVTGCCCTLAVYWIYLFVAGHSTYVHGCTSYCEDDLELAQGSDSV